MKDKKYVIIVLAILLVAVIVLININKKENKKESINVVTTFYPVYIATLNVVDGVEGINVSNLTNNVTGCLHEYTLSPVQMANISKADILIENGSGMEPFISNIIKNYPALNIVDTSINTNILEGHESHEHEHEEEKNSHIYLDIQNYMVQLKNIYNGIIKIDNKNVQQYTENYNEYINKLKVLKNSYDKIKNNMTDKNVVIYNGAIEYIANMLDLNVVANLELDHDNGITASEKIEVIEKIKEQNVKYIFVSSDYDEDTISSITNNFKDVKIIKINLLTYGKNNKESYINMMSENLNNIKREMVVKYE